MTFGAYKTGQLGRRCDERFWFAKPDFVPEFGPERGCIANWVSAHGDVTLVQYHRQLFTRAELADCYITASRDSLILAPKDPEKDFVLLRRTGNTPFNRFRLGAHATSLRYVTRKRSITFSKRSVLASHWILCTAPYSGRTTRKECGSVRTQILRE